MSRDLGRDLPGLLGHVIFCACVTALNGGVVRHERQHCVSTYRTLTNKCAALVCACNILLSHTWWPMALARTLDFGWPDFVCSSMVLAMYSTLTQIWLAQNELIILCYLYACKFHLVCGLREDLAATIMFLTNFMLSLLVAFAVFMLNREKINGYRKCLGDDSFEGRLLNPTVLCSTALHCVTETGSPEDLSPIFYIVMSSSTWLIHATFSSMIIYHNRKYSSPPTRALHDYQNQNNLMDCTSSLLQMLVHVSIPPVLTVLYLLLPMRPGLNLAGLYRLAYSLSLVVVLPVSMYLSNAHLRRTVVRDFKSFVLSCR